MRHVSRTHRVALDWLFDRINLDPKIQIKYIDTKNQLADIQTKANFTRDEWNHLLCLFNISHFSTACIAAIAKRVQQESGEGRVTAKSRPMTKITRAPCRRRNGEAVPRAVNFGDLITADHKVLSDNCESRNNHRYAVVVQDLATQWIQAYPCKNKTSQETQRSLQKFLEPERKPKVIYTANCLEFGKVCEDLSWNHCTSTPHRSETNGIAERAVRRVKEGTSAVLLQSGLNESWWADTMECYTYLRNVTDPLSDGKTPYERRFGQPFKGPIIPFGSLVDLLP